MGCHFLLQCMRVKSESEVAQSCPTLLDPMDCSLPGSSMGFSRQEYCSGLPLTSPYGCKSWTIKKAEQQGIGAFELYCWRRLLRIPWTSRRSNQSILEEISPGISLEGMMLKLKLQYFGHLMRRVDSLEKTLMLVGIGGKRKRG